MHIAVCALCEHIDIILITLCVVLIIYGVFLWLCYSVQATAVQCSRRPIATDGENTMRHIAKRWL